MKNDNDANTPNNPIDRQCFFFNDYRISSVNSAFSSFSSSFSSSDSLLSAFC